MGCKGCGRTARTGKATYKYLTRSQIEIRFNKFKDESCSKFCHRVDECNIFEYKVCKNKKTTIELL